MENIDDNIFEERADYISETDISDWNVELPYFEKIQKRLLDKGAKVIVGPRGCGKTHQMRLAYKKCISDIGNPYPIYVSFSKYYYLEPLLTKNSKAIKIFHTWVLLRILLSCNDTLKNLNKDDLDLSSLDISYTEINKFIAQSEKGVYEPWHDKIISTVTIQSIVDIINKTCKECGRKRTILLLDDAALSLTKEYMIEFFDIFRSFKSVSISPKASVYPGTTEYGPRFHLKQDGDPFNVWFHPTEAEYDEFVAKLIIKRLPEIKIDEDIISLLKYASFGNPRAFITLIRDFMENDKKTVQAKFNNVLEIRCKLLKDEYHSLKQKLKQYNTIIDTGWMFFENLTNEIVDINKRISAQNGVEKKIIVGISNFDNAAIQRMIKFLIEAGLIYELDSVKHGENREYKRYMPHLAFLLQKKGFSSSRGFNAKSIKEFIELKDSKHPIRKDSIENILGDNYLNLLKLDLPNCTVCGAERISENQKFCHSCGSELVTKSTFEECMGISVEELPLTDWQKNKIINETNIRTIEDFVKSANINDELRKPYGIGEKKALKIVNVVNKLIEEFLE